MLIARHSTKKVAQILFAGHHLTSIRVRRPTSHTESPAAHCRFRTSQCTTMASSVSDILEGLSLKPTAKVSHTETTSPASWKNALIVSGSAPSSFELIKTLVYKPKTAKTANTTPVVVIAREETETNSGAIGKKLNLKELRLASEDLLAEFFSLDKHSCTFESRCNDLTSVLIILFVVSPLSITESTFSRVITVLDSSIASSSSLFGVHANSSKETVFLSGKDVESYLKGLETGDIKVQEIDFTALATTPGVAAQTSKVKEKEDAKIEGAVQIAIGVKKEVDFPSWYTNVRLISCART
jgi:prolyl-tRNA synthetase